MDSRTDLAETRDDLQPRPQIRHDYEGGTIIEGTEKNGSWTWSRYANAWLLRSSRHTRPKPHKIAEIERILTDLGYTVERDVDDTMPSVARQEEDLAERMEQRTDRLNERSAKMAGVAAATRKKADDVFNGIPFGQPMLVDHHSYAADRNRRERASKNLGKSIEQGNYAGDLAKQAEVASHHVGARNSPVTVANRIEKLQADQRRFQRELDGEQHFESYTAEDGQRRQRLATRYPSPERAEYVQGEIAALDERIKHWQEVFAQLQTEGKASTLGPDTVAKGDWVRVRGDWMRVRRVNKKSVSVPNPNFPPARQGEREDTWTVPWRKLSGRRTTDQMPADYVQAYETSGTDRITMQRRGRQ